MRRAILFLAMAWCLPGQEPAAEQEAKDLSVAVAEAGSSPVDFTRALEGYLRRYPNAKARAQIEKALAKSAVEAGDRPRIVLYGEKVLQAEPESDDLQLLDRLTRALLETDDPATGQKALGYAHRYERAVEAMGAKPPQGHMSPGQWAEEVNKGRARVLSLEARATGNTGRTDEAATLARRAWDAYTTPETAREVAHWAEKRGQTDAAIEFFADAFVLEDTRSSETDRAKDRLRLGELYTKLHGSPKGLGDTILEAYDRTVGMKNDRMAALKRADPNAGANEILEFTLPPVEGTGADSLGLASLKGKTVILDFWATWCGPCRAQHPLIENVKKRFEKDASVVFLSVDADDDRALVPGFLKEMHWSGRNYYEAGLSRLLSVSSIPTIVVIDPRGAVSSRMAGFIPERFEAMLTERIEETLTAESRKN